MRIIFYGTPDFAVESLRALVEAGKQIVAVVTATDKWGGRNKSVLLESAVKKYAVSEGLLVLQPEKLKNPDFLEQIRALKPDLQIVVAFRMMPEVLWSMPPMGTFNLHGSLLPNYRGAAPINWAIINGEKETGVTTFFLKHEIDTGQIIYQEKTPIEAHETVEQVYNRLMAIGAKLVVKTVEDIEQGNVTTWPQDETIVSHAPKLFEETCQIDASKSAEAVHNFIRGLSPYPGAWMLFEGKKLKVYLSKVVENQEDFVAQGQTICGPKRFLLGTGEGGLVEFLEVQQEGKKRLDVKSFLNGYRPT